MLLSLDKLNPISFWEYFTLFLIGFGCFLIGWIFANRSAKSKYKKLSETPTTTINNLKSSSSETTASQENNGVRAIKTRERAGKLVGASNNVENLMDLTNIGSATFEDRNDLKLISGIGPFIENKLNTIGIYTFDQISKLTKEDIEKVTELISFFPGRIERDNWKDQAKSLKKKNA